MLAANILIVDDDDFQSEVLSSIVSTISTNLKLDSAFDGRQALEKIRAKSPQYDVILLDWEMPELDGIAVLKEIRSDKKLNKIPVIMQTAKADKEDFIVGMQAGAYHYLTKPYDQEVVTTIVSSAIVEKQRNDTLHAALKSQDESIKLITQATYEFKTIQHANMLASILSNIADQPESLVAGLAELLINAIEHGNLGISYDEKSDFKKNGNWEQEIEHRLQQPKYKNRIAKVEIVKKPSSLEFTISDEGDGFDWEPYMDFSVDRVLDSHGRGIAIANKTCFSSVNYQGKGNIVTAKVDIS